MKNQFPFFLILLIIHIACNSSDLSKVKSNKAEFESPVKVQNIEGMLWIDGGSFTMGSIAKTASKSEGPLVKTKVDGFWMDETEVTNDEFQEFVNETGYITVAERPVNWEEIKNNYLQALKNHRMKTYYLGA